jgi:hypothetical protein
MTAASEPSPSLVLHTIENLAAFHREHEKFYAAAPREQAIELQRHARTLHALADRWSRPLPPHLPALSPYEGAEDLNDRTAVQLDGVLFLEGQGVPPELWRIERELRSRGEETLATGNWMSAAMQTAWDAATALLVFAPLADQIGERHRIIANDWQAAGLNTVVGRLLARAAEILERMDLTPAGVRADLAGEARFPHLLHATAELIDRAADLLSESAGLVHDNERRWRIFHERVAGLMRADSPVAAEVEQADAS